MERILESTADGSYTLYVPQMDEHYHSTKGARTESQHIFIRMGLQASSASVPHVLEAGFGTGLNAWLTLVEAERAQRHVRYTGVELYPLPWKTVERLGYVAAGERIAVDGRMQEALPLFEQLHRVPWGKECTITPHFTLTKLQADLTRLPQDISGLPPADVVYFDAFAPEKQPEMWSPRLFAALYGCMAPGGILTTYCAKGCVRRMWQEVGFRVERLPGPPGGKREMLRATKEAE